MQAMRRALLIGQHVHVVVDVLLSVCLSVWWWTASLRGREGGGQLLPALFFCWLAASVDVDNIAYLPPLPLHPPGVVSLVLYLTMRRVVHSCMHGAFRRLLAGTANSLR